MDIDGVDLLAIPPTSDYEPPRLVLPGGDGPEQATSDRGLGLPSDAWFRQHREVADDVVSDASGMVQATLSPPRYYSGYAFEADEATMEFAREQQRHREMLSPRAPAQARGRATAAIAAAAATTPAASTAERRGGGSGGKPPRSGARG